MWKNKCRRAYGADSLLYGMRFFEVLKQVANIAIHADIEKRVLLANTIHFNFD